MNRKFKRIMGYIFKPILFMVVGYGFVGIALSPFYDVALAATNLIMSDQAPNFSGDLTTIFDPNANWDVGGTVDISSIEIPTFGTHYAEIRSSRIGLSASVFWGDSYEILRQGVGQFTGSFLPGFGGTTLLAAHNMMHFLPLFDIEMGDIVEITTNYGHFIYQVNDIQILEFNDPSAIDLAQREKELLVMYTCYPFSISGITSQRLFIYAERISGPDVIYATE